MLQNVNTSFVGAKTDADSNCFVQRGFLTFDVSQFTNATSGYLKLDSNNEANYRLIFVEANQADTLNTSTALSSFTSINRAIKYTDLFWYNSTMMLPLTAEAITKINQNSLLRVAILTEQDYNLNVTLNTTSGAFLQNPKLIIS